GGERRKGTPLPGPLPALRGEGNTLYTLFVVGLFDLALALAGRGAILLDVVDAGGLLRAVHPARPVPLLLPGSRAAGGFLDALLGVLHLVLELLLGVLHLPLELILVHRSSPPLSRPNWPRPRTSQSAAKPYGRAGSGRLARER